MKLSRTIGLLGATAMLLVLGSSPMLAGSDGSTRGTINAFGADLSSKPFPNEAGGTGPQTCDENPSAACTRVMTQAYGTNGRLKAPRNGEIDKIKIIALDDGTARLFMAKIDPSDPFSAKVTRKGPQFSYQGQPDTGPVFVNTIDIPNMTVLKGEVIALKAVELSALRGGSGGNRHLEFQPGLTVAEGYRESDDDNSFHMLVRVIYE
jgi:hypothetical protein